MQAAAILNENEFKIATQESTSNSDLLSKTVISKKTPFGFFIKFILGILILSGIIGIYFNVISVDTNINTPWDFTDYLKFISFIFPVIPTLLYSNSKLKIFNFNLIVFSIFFMTFVVSFSSSDLVPPTLFWVLIIPIISHLLLPIVFSISWSVISLIGVIIFMDLHFENVGHHPLFLSLFFLMILVILFSVFYQKIFFYHTNLIEQKNQQIKNFLQIIGHDLSTPLFIISSNAEVALKKIQKEAQKELDPSDPEIKKWMAVSRASESMKDILNIVLDLQALENGKIQINTIPTDPIEIIEMSILNFNNRLKIKGIEINFENKLKQNTKVLVDPVIFENQILNNIISNAIKFSNPNGRISILATEDSSFVTVQVTDSGLGIPRDILYNVFRWDKKTSRKGTSGESGTGFGLPLVRKFIDLFGGKIEIESRFIDEYQNNHGTTVRLFLPKK